MSDSESRRNRKLMCTPQDRWEPCRNPECGYLVPVYSAGAPKTCTPYTDSDCSNIVRGKALTDKVGDNHEVILGRGVMTACKQFSRSNCYRDKQLCANYDTKCQTLYGFTPRKGCKGGELWEKSVIASGIIGIDTTKIMSL